MLAQIICQFQEFQRVHNKCPNVAYLNPYHYTVLREEFPEIFSDDSHPDEIVPLKIKVVLVPKELLSHPRVACILPGSSQIFNCKARSAPGRSHRSQVGSLTSRHSAYAG